MQWPPLDASTGGWANPPGTDPLGAEPPGGGTPPPRKQTPGGRPPPPVDRQTLLKI